MQLVLKEDNNFLLLNMVESEIAKEFRKSLTDYSFYYIDIKNATSNKFIEDLKSKTIYRLDKQILEQNGINIKNYNNRSIGKIICNNQKRIISDYIDGKFNSYEYVDLLTKGEGEFYIVSNPVLIPCEGEKRYICENILKLPKLHLDLLLLEKGRYDLINEDYFDYILPLFKKPEQIEKFSIEEVEYYEKLGIINLNDLEKKANESAKVLKKVI